MYTGLFKIENNVEIAIVNNEGAIHTILHQNYT